MLHTIDYTIIGVFLTITVAVGLWFSRRWRGSEGFFLAGRDLTWPFIGFSLFATNISAEHFVGLASAGHDDGLVQGGYEWIASYCLIMLAAVFAPQYVRHRVYTIPEFFEKRYGVEVRVALSVYFLAMIVLTKVAMALYSGGRVIQHFMGWDLDAVMWTVGILTAIYTMAGGLSAVVYTDFVQALVLIAGSVILTVKGLAAAGGWSGLTAVLEARGAGDMLSMVRPPEDPKLPFSGFLLGNFLLGGMFYWCMDQVNVQRVLGARDERHARLGAILAGFLKIVPVFVLVLPGVVAFVLYDDISDHKATYGILVERLLGTGLKGLVLAALFAALMSSLSSSFNSVATIAARDLLARFRPQSSVRLQIGVGQIVLVAVLVGGVYATRFTAASENLWDYLQEVTGYLSAPFAVAGLFGVFSRRVNRPGVLAGIGASVAAGSFLFADSKLAEPFLSHPLLASFLHRSFLAALIAAVTLVGVSLLTAPPPEEVRRGRFCVLKRSGDPGEGAGAPQGGLLGSPWLWLGVLFALVTWLWWTFR